MVHAIIAKVGLVTRTVANAAAALRTVPAGRNQRTFLCAHYCRARIPDRTDMQDFDALVRCAATADVLRTGLHVQVSRVRRNQASACLLHCVCNSAVEGRIATRTASVHERAAQISIARCAGHACSSSCPSGLATFVDHCGRFVVHERRNQFASAYAALCLRLGLRRSRCCVRLHANAMEDGRKPSQRRGQRSYDALRRSKLKFAGRRFHERSLRADDTHRGLASSDVAKLGSSQAALPTTTICAKFAAPCH